MKAVTALTLSLLLPAAALAQTVSADAISALGPTSTLLSISSEGRSQRIPDLALFNAGVVSQGSTAAEAMADNSRRMDAVIAALKRSGIAPRDIQTSAITLQPRYSNPELEAQIVARQTRQPYVPPANPGPPRIIGYEARNSVSVRVRKLGEMGRIIDTLIASGANQVDGPSFTLDDQKQALDEARAEAIADGRARAELYARSTGLRVARILSISEGGGYYPVQQVFVSARGGAMGAPPPPPPAPVAPGELTLGVNLSMQFELVR